VTITNSTSISSILAN